jgi:hypothetical protein
MSNIKEGSRRNFLKKAAYCAPVIVGLGTLATPKPTHASSTNSGLRKQYREYKHRGWNSSE